METLLVSRIIWIIKMYFHLPLVLPYLPEQNSLRW